MLEKIESILRDECGLPKDELIVVGVSGGPDSLCLLQILRQAGYPVLAAYFNHGLRPEAEEEAAAVEGIAASLSVPSVCGSGDVRAQARLDRESIEEAARNLRYRFLFDVARQRSAQAVAVGHTADDQVETVLMHFLRGTGLAGLRGMPYRTLLVQYDTRIPLVRPLLDIRRDQTEAFCAAQGMQPRRDASNESLEFLRNRIRHELIPALESYNPQFREVVRRTARAVSADHDLLSDVVAGAWEECVLGPAPGKITFDLPRLRTYGPALQRNLIRRAVQTLNPEQELDHAALERATAFIAQGMRSMSIDLKGRMRLALEGTELLLLTADAELVSDGWPQMPEQLQSMPITIPGGYELSGGWNFSCSLAASRAQARESARQNEDQFQIWADADVLPPMLELRSRRPGDRLLPLGMAGHSMKLSDIMVNEKIPARARARWPLLCAGDTIIWLPGYRLGHSYRLRTSSRRILHCAISRPARHA